MRQTLPRRIAIALLVSVSIAGCAATDDTGGAPFVQPIAQTQPVASPPAFAPPPTIQQTAFREELTAPPGQFSPLPAPSGPAPTTVVGAPGANEELLSERFPLDLPTALAMTQGQNPRVAFAQAQIAQSVAQHQAARVLWLPSIRGGLNYDKHEGRIQDIEGRNLEVSRSAAYGGLGAFALGAGPIGIPGIFAQFHTTDAIYQRQITGFALDAREFQSSAVLNDQLLETALAYLSLLDAAQRRAIASQTLVNGEELTKLTGEFARTGAGNLADADRAAAALSLIRNEYQRTEEAQAVASARLAQQLSVDPTVTIEPQESTVVPVEIVPPGMGTADLVATALTNRPELAASRSLVCEAVNRLRREEHAPWLPSVLLGISYGQFAAGRGGQLINPGDRFDFDGVAWWELRNLGFGEKAARDNARAQIQQARLREVETMDLVAREVVEAHVQVQARRRQIAVAQEGIVSASHSHDRNIARIRNLQGLPIEALQSIQALDNAQRDYLRTVVDYNTAQFRLQRALGWPISYIP